MKFSNFHYFTQALSSILLTASLGCQTISPLTKTARANGTVKQQIEQLITQINPGLNAGMQFISMRTGKVIYERNPDQLFTPASTLKLLTTAAALNYLGPEFRYETKLVMDGHHLVLVGSGDPTFTAQDLKKLIGDLALVPNKHISGDLIIDASIFDGVSYGWGWMWDDLDRRYSAPVSGINVDGNILPAPAKNRFGGVSKEPIMYAGKIILEELKRHGIHLTDNIIEAKAPADAPVVAIHKSASLGAMLTELNKASDDHGFECLLKTVGSRVSQGQGTFANGLKAVKDFLQNEVGIDSSQFVAADASGLSRYSLFSPRQMNSLLRYAFNNFAMSAEFMTTLPIGGVDGTLRNRLKDMPAVRRIRAKTGSMTSMSSLAGYLFTDDNDTIVFSMMINGIAGSVRPYHKLQGDILTLFISHPAKNAKVN